MDPRDIFDAFRVSSLDRVSPLAQIARGRHQFFSDKGTCPRPLVVATALYYVCLKVLSLLVYVGFPALAVASRRFTAVAWPNEVPLLGKYIVYAFVLAAAIVLLQTLLIDVLAVVRTLRIITARNHSADGASIA